MTGGARSAGVLTRRRRPGRRPAARRRPHLSETLLRRPVANVGHEQPAMSRRAASLCAALLTSVPVSAPAGAAGADVALSAPAPACDAVHPVYPAQLLGLPSLEAAFVRGRRGWTSSHLIRLTPVRRL